MISAAKGPIDSLASGARRMINERPGARVRRVRRMGHRGLANLWELHPEARRAAIREAGLQSVPVDRIAGTAVEGAPQRAGDFLPLKERRSADWRSRWQRIMAALDRLESLPPVDLIKLGEDYWVVDGHNRVAAALYNGQVEIDAVVQELRAPGARFEAPSANLASVPRGQPRPARRRLGASDTRGEEIPGCVASAEHAGQRRSRPGKRSDSRDQPRLAQQLSVCARRRLPASVGRFR